MNEKTFKCHILYTNGREEERIEIIGAHYCDEAEELNYINVDYSRFHNSFRTCINVKLSL
jgi:hypothetical protein